MNEAAQKKFTNLLKRLSLLIGLIALVLSGTGCGASPLSGAPAPDRTYAVDPLFRDFYDFLGGKAVLGAAISNLLIRNSIKCQFTESALLVYDPNPAVHDHFRLAPLGLELGVTDPPVEQPSAPGGRLVAGHTLYPEFQQLYERLGGARFAGRPLTEMHYNPEKKRYEQYFENVGFYRLEGDPVGSAHLLSYGAYRCDNVCRASPPVNATIDVQPAKDSPFAAVISRLGQDFTGFPLTDAYIAQADGRIEQIFANLVLFGDAAHPESALLRPLTDKLGILPDPKQPASKAAGVFFFEVDHGQGYDIPLYNLNYLTRHGGLELSGPPISAPAPLNDRLSRQCFRNLCLDYDPTAAEAAQVRPAPLGYTYRQLYYQPAPVFSTQSAQALSVQVWESHPVVASGQGQEIGVSVQQDNGPLPNVEPVLTITLPDGRHETYHLPLTGADGITRQAIPAVEAQNGVLVPYQVCITQPLGGRYCVKDSYVIWNP